MTDHGDRGDRMINPIQRWLDRRRADDEARIEFVLRASPDLPGLQIAHWTRIGVERLYVVLARMETAGRVTSRWEPGPLPRRRLYQLAPPTAAPAWPVRVTVTDVYLRLPEDTLDVDITVGGAKVGRLTLTTDQYAEIVGEHPEDRCNRCGGQNIAWSAPSPLWNQVMRGGDINGTEIHDGIICPTCFAVLAQEAGIADLWRFDAGRVHVPLQTVTPSGRIWDAEAWLWREPTGDADA
jgi:hypothetical protein